MLQSDNTQVKKKDIIVAFRILKQFFVKAIFVFCTYIGEIEGSSNEKFIFSYLYSWCVVERSSCSVLSCFYLHWGLVLFWWLIISAFYSFSFSSYVCLFRVVLGSSLGNPYWNFENKYVILSWIINIVYLTYNTT